MFTDGSINGQHRRCCSSFTPGVRRLSSDHSPLPSLASNQAPRVELAALLLGCHHAVESGPHTSITFVSDSQAALRSLSETCQTLALIATICESLLALTTPTQTVKLWWTPAHSSLKENELADEATKAAAQGTRPPDEVIPIPTVPHNFESPPSPPLHHTLFDSVASGHHRLRPSSSDATILTMPLLDSMDSPATKWT